MGNRGRMGSFLTELFRGKGFEIKGSDILDENTDRRESEIRNSDAVVLAVPQEVALKFVKDHADLKNIIEIGSVKTIFSEFVGKIVCIHPLFGPLSHKNKARKQIIFIDDISPPEKKEMIMKLFGQIELVSMTADRHDRIMADILVAPYIISILSSRVEIHKDLSTRSSRLLEHMADISKAESGEVLKKTISMNPYSPLIFRKIMEGIRDLGGEI
ncbi:prephenate dehydrogenase/arogenate dehydrogenase family protein [Oxyplasma meridianum]|uniref:Prephenate dehydrogenase/arogenate dehydrogenase family protein n=1 Tax=Oxyplasma meridianum TaxID=3073602 RepID=A0AAX4NEH0_9ARCH